MKYKTKKIDLTGCNPIIAEHLKRGEAVLCEVWDQNEDISVTEFVQGWRGESAYPYIAGDSAYKHAEPIPTRQRIMPPERAIPVLISEGWRFHGSGSLVKPMDPAIYPDMFKLMGRLNEGEEVGSRVWPTCILEEVDE